MDIASVIGIILGVLVLLATVLLADGASFAGFIDYPSMMLVFGGAGAAVLIAFPLRTLLGVGGVARKVFLNQQPELPQLIETLVSLAETARRDGLLALETRLEEVDSPFMALGIQMAVDGARPEVIEDIMRTEINAIATRHRDGKAVMEQIGRFAPAFGMVGTVAGLIIMLGNMDDPSKLGGAMAVTMITTLYGALLSNFICLPFAEKLGFINKKELLSLEIIVRGIIAIQSGENPRVIEQKLNTFLPPKQRGAYQKEAA